MSRRILEHAVDGVTGGFDVVLVLADLRQIIGLAEGHRHAGKNQSREGEIIAADLKMEVLLLSREGHEHRQLIAAQRLELCPLGPEALDIAQIHAGAAEQHKVVLIVLICQWVGGHSDIDLHQSRLPRQILCLAGDTPSSM